MKLTKKNIRAVKNKDAKHLLQRDHALGKEAKWEAKVYQDALPDSAGFLEPEHADEKVSRLRQQQIRALVPTQNAKKMFSLGLEADQEYSLKYTRNGRHLLLGGSRGHYASFDWQSGRLQCEGNLESGEVVRDLAWLQNETFFALAQKNYVYMYDHSGTEVHRLNKHQQALRLDFLPFHYLLASASADCCLRYQDVSLGSLVAEHSFKGAQGGACTDMVQNRHTGVMHLGHASGAVTLWSPALNTYLAKVHCHQGSVHSLAVDHEGLRMATAGADGKLKVWDLRTYKMIDEYRTLRPAHSLDFSQRGLLAVGNGPNVTVWRDIYRERQHSPYLGHLLPGRSVHSVRFSPFEDVLGVGHTGGFESLLVPGSGEPNYDSLDANPFANRKQRQQAEVHSLLDKLAPDTIGLDPRTIGAVTRDHEREVVPARLAQAQHNISSAGKEKKKMRGRSTAMKRYLKKRANVIDEHKVRAKEEEKVEIIRNTVREDAAASIGALSRFVSKSA